MFDLEISVKEFKEKLAQYDVFEEALIADIELYEAVGTDSPRH